MVRVRTGDRRCQSRVVGDELRVLEWCMPELLRAPLLITRNTNLSHKHHDPTRDDEALFKDHRYHHDVTTCKLNCNRNIMGTMAHQNETLCNLEDVKSLVLVPNH